ncbi:carbamate kinase [soil metagenome]
MTDESTPAGVAPQRKRTVVALGGNAIAPAGTGGTAEEQTRNIRRAMELIAELIVDGREIVITHGNGPQVGNLLRKNEIAKDVVPPMPLDWCVAQTQATIGYQMITALEHALEALGDLSTVVPVISRIEVSPDDPAWSDPSKPIGPFMTDADEVERRRSEDGHDFVDLGDRGWRRVVPSPQPVRLLESMTINLLLDAGAVVVANGGGGIPMVRTADNLLRGVEAVIDKDLAGALLARQLRANGLVILTDVDGVAIDFGSPQEQWLSKVTASELRAHADDGQFARGSMGPKVAAALSFVEHTGEPAAIGSLDDVGDVVRGEAGTLIVPDGEGNT